MTSRSLLTGIASASSRPVRLDAGRSSHRLIDVVGYRVVADVDRSGEGVQPGREVELVPHHFAIVVCISELSMHMRVKPKAVREQLRV